MPILAIAACLAGALAQPFPAWAATMTVTTIVDEVTSNGQCSLREAIRNANADAQTHPDCPAGTGADVIVLPASPNDDYDLSLAGANEDAAATGDLDIVGTLTIQGGGGRDSSPTLTRIDALGLGDRVFHVRSGAVVTISGINIAETNAGTGFGAGLLNLGGQVTLTDVWFYDSQTSSGGGITLHNSGQMTLNGVQIDAARGSNGSAAITSLGTLTVSGATITRGGATSGAVYGIRVDGGSATLSNVTIVDQSATSAAGLFVGASAGTVTLTNGTIVGNDAGIQRSGGTLTVRNTLLAGNGPGDNCIGTIVSGGYNLSDDASCTSFAQPGDLPANTDPLLEPSLFRPIPFPWNNGGLVDTIPLPPGSPAIDAGNPATPLDGAGGRCPATDQRGAPRPQDGDGANGARCDIGAFELVRLVVDSTSDEVDAAPGNGACATAAPARCTLRAAVMEANGLGGALIVVPSSATPYTLTRSGVDDTAQAGDLDLTIGNTVVRGGGAASTIVDGGGLDRVFDLRTGSVEIADLTIRNGNASGSGQLGDGGGIRVGVPVRLTVRRSVLSGNHAARDGGGIAIDRSDLTIADSTIDANIAARDGGGVAATSDGDMTVTGTTLSANQASRGGGGLFLDDFDAVLTNVTVSNNQASLLGGGILVDASNRSPTVQVTNVTIANNQAPTTGGLDGPANGTVRLRSTIIANNTGGDCASARFFSDGYNLSGDTSCNFVSSGDQPGVNPRLGSLADNGGPTRTLALLFGSPAIDTGSPAQPGSGPTACATTDQRGRPRPRDGDGANGARCDVGAFELQDPYQIDLAVSLAATPDPVLVGQSLTYTATVTNNGLATATTVALTDVLPAGVTLGSANASQGGCSGTSTVACNLGSLVSGASATVTIVVTPTQAGQVSNTVSVSGSPSDPNPANNTATVTTAAQANCQPRPNVRVTTSRGAAGQLNATLAAQTSTATPANVLVSVQITRIDNATVRLNGSPVAVGPPVSLPAGAQQATLLVERHAPAQNVNAPSTVAFTVTDGCGTWPSFVGGGPTAF